MPRSQSTLRALLMAMLPKPRRFQFSLRALLGLAAIVGLLLGCVDKCAGIRQRSLTPRRLRRQKPNIIKKAAATEPKKMRAARRIGRRRRRRGLAPMLAGGLYGFASMPHDSVGGAVDAKPSTTPPIAGKMPEPECLENVAPAMAISSRTPEGQPNTCPVCKGVVCVEPSLALGNAPCCDAPCPNCGTLLWFVRRETGSRLYRADQMDGLAKRIADAFDLAGDSLDTVELVMELESEYEIRISEDDAERVATIEGAMAYLREHLSQD